MKRPPRDYDTLRDEILARLPKLSHRLQQVARFAMEHPNDVALQTITMLASRMRVPPSTIIRFAKALDYRGFSDMQAVFREPLSSSFSNGNGGHLDAFNPDAGKLSAIAALTEVQVAGYAALEQLISEVSPSCLEKAAELLATRHIVYVVGQGSAFPAAAYLAYALAQLQRPVHLLDGRGGMLFEQASGITDQDVLIALSFPQYALETAELAARTADRGIEVIAITNSPLDPLAGSADVCLEVHEHEVYTFPTLIATLNLVQSLVITVGLRRVQSLLPARLTAEVDGYQ